jgi:hypothetical protein
MYNRWSSIVCLAHPYEIHHWVWEKTSENNLFPSSLFKITPTHPSQLLRGRLAAQVYLKCIFWAPTKLEIQYLVQRNEILAICVKMWLCFIWLHHIHWCLHSYHLSLQASPIIQGYSFDTSGIYFPTSSHSCTSVLSTVVSTLDMDISDVVVSQSFLSKKLESPNHMVQQSQKVHKLWSRPINHTSFTGHPQPQLQHMKHHPPSNKYFHL